MLENYISVQGGGITPWLITGALMPFAAILDVVKLLFLPLADVASTGDGGLSRKLLALDVSLCISILGIIGADL